MSKFALMAGKSVLFFFFKEKLPQFSSFEAALAVLGTTIIYKLNPIRSAEYLRFPPSNF